MKEVYILIVEDSKTQAEQLKHVLKSNHFKTQIATSGDKALKLLTSIIPDLIITDIIMPGMNGFELCRNIKANPKTEKIPIILLTTLSSTEDIVMGLASGADNFITKPYDDNYLVHTIDACLKEKPVTGNEEESMYKITSGGLSFNFISSQERILNFLSSSYEVAIQRNKSLELSQRKILELNTSLERRIIVRTQQIKQINNILLAIRNINQLIITERDRETLVKEACKILVSTKGFETAWISLLDDQNNIIDYHEAGSLESGEKIEHNGSVNKNSYCVQKAISGNKVFVIENIGEVCKDCARSATSFNSSLGMMFMGLWSGGRCYGVINVTVKKQYLQNEELQSLFSEVVEDIAYALHNLEVEEKRRIADVALQKSETILNESQQISHIGSWELDIINNILYWSDEVYRIFDLEPQEFEATNEAFIEHVHPDDRNMVNDAYTKSLKTRTSYNVTHRLLLKDGILKYVNEMGEHFYDTKGNPIRSVGMVQDITERKQAEDTLKESERRLKESQHIAHMGQWELDIVNNHLYWSDGIYNLFEIDPDKFAASYEAFLDAIHPDDRDFVNNAYTTSLKNKTPYDIIHRLLLKNGTIKYVNEICRTEYDKNGNALRSVGTVQDITELKQAEESLIQSTNIINRSPAVAFLWKNEKSWPVEFVSDNVEKLTGYTKQEFMEGKISYIEIIAPDDLERVAKEVAVFSKKKDINTFTHKYYRIITKNREIKWVNNDTYIRRNSSGIITHYEGIVYDVTERKQAEWDIRKSEAQKQAILDGISINIAFLNKDLEILWANKAFAESVGKSPEEMLGHTCHSFRADPEKPCDECPSLKAFQTKKSEQTVLQTPDGRIWDERGEPVFDMEGNMIGAIAIAHDITIHKQAEKTLLLNEYRIKTRLELLQMEWAEEKEILDFSLEKMLNITESKIGYIAFMNEDETELTMYSLSAEVMKKCKVAGIPIIYPVAGTGLWGEAVRQRKAIITNDYTAPNPLKKGIPDGHVKIIRHMNVPVFDGDKIVMVAGVGNKEKIYSDSDADQLTMIMTDMWQLIQKRRAENELKKHRNHLEELVKERTKDIEAFSYSISHDLRAPLRAISGFSEILANEYKDKLDDEANRLLKVISKNALNMNQLITDLLNFSRIGHKRVKTGKINMKNLAREVFDELRQIYPKRDIKFKLGEIPSATGDRNLIRLVFTNLISNAIKFSGNEKVPKIEIGSQKKDKQQYYYIKDNGVGFDMKYVDKIFGVFQKLHSPDKFEGNGVGLAIVQKIIQNHGGKVWAEGEVDKGSTFYFSLSGS